MKLFNKKNILPIIGLSYTVVVLFIVISEIVESGMSPTHFNLLMALVYTLIALGILALHPLLDHLSPLVMIVLQYIIALGLILLVTYLTGYFEPLHPYAYKDATRSFTQFYLIGALIYYIHLLVEIKKQNKALKTIKNLHPHFDQ